MLLTKTSLALMQSRQLSSEMFETGSPRLIGQNYTDKTSIQLVSRTVKQNIVSAKLDNN